MRPWIIFERVLIIISILHAILTLFNNQDILGKIVNIIIIAVRLYLWSCANSLFKSLNTVNFELMVEEKPITQKI